MPAPGGTLLASGKNLIAGKDVPEFRPGVGDELCEVTGENICDYIGK